MMVVMTTFALGTGGVVIDLVVDVVVGWWVVGAGAWRCGIGF
jgi:hypothetical protein